PHASSRGALVSVQLPEAEEPRRPESEVLRVKDAGEGAVQASDPFSDFWMPSFTPETYPAPEVPGADGGVVSGGDIDWSNGLVAEAKKWIGTPYKWGGSGPLGFDCSGFTQYVMRKFGIELPRVSYQQASGGTRVGLDELRPGDLVAWDNSSRNNGADHIAIYIGGGKVIHAPKPGDSVKISSIWDSANVWGVRYREGN